MAKGKDSFVRWLKNPGVCKKINKANRIDTESTRTLSTDMEPQQTTMQPNDVEPTYPTISTNEYKREDIRHCDSVINDDYELFMRLSNRPGSQLLERRVRKHRSHPSEERYESEQTVEPLQSDTHNAGNGGNADELRRVFSLNEGGAQRFKPSAIRRELARASFRTRSVRDSRTATKKLDCVPRITTMMSEQQIGQICHVSPRDLNNTARHDSSHTPGHLDIHRSDYSTPTDLYRIRSFRVTKKKVINLGDKLRSKSVSGLPAYSDQHFNGSRVDLADVLSYWMCEERANSPATNSTFAFPRSPNDIRFANISQPNSPASPTTLLDTRYVADSSNRKQQNLIEQPIRIQVVGAPNVGKTALCRQLLTSDYLGARMESISEDTVERHLTVELNQQTWNLVLIDNFGEINPEEVAWINSMKTFEHAVQSSSDAKLTVPSIQLLPHSKTSGSTLLTNVQAYLLVYAVDDHRSFEYISQVLKLLQKSIGSAGNKVSLVVASKVDLVRKRLVSTTRGKKLANVYGCKYFEISTAINHMVDELLVELILQVERTQRKLSKSDQFGIRMQADYRFANFRSSGEALLRYFRRQLLARSCEDVKNV